ncbi:hypothetical protein B0A54_03506 [Friedmanniomyces endolithicus]|uniref:precorrin-2 dehydrogenase n=1 Tax=Friedmanniomyces endolithicus TaxID=329885 RepID=A0A4U0VA84_9PEZI|nr:hypothetical protein B0A54_03506 [Friedmanniomyces endolithicus]
MADEHFPEIQGGGSLILAWQVRNKKVLVVGGGEVAAGRILNLLNADAKVTLISPRDGLNPEVAHRIERGQVTYHDKLFEPSDLDDPAITMVMTAVDDPEASTRIWKLCKEKRIAANIADVPQECDFYFGSVHRDGPLQIMVSTNGNGPKMANIVRRRIAATLPPNIGEAIAKVGALRKKLRVLAPGDEQGPKRMKWMSKVCVQWSLEDLCDMEDVDMNELLQGYVPDQVPSLSQVRSGEEPGVWQFDGSYGWSCLTKTLLKCHFGLTISLPDDRLCPPVPVRWNYIRWIQQLLDTTSETYTDRYDPSREVLGLDIGVGASCIYPLLACASRPQWRMMGTEIDQHSLDYARKNVVANGLEQRARLKLSSSAEAPLIPLDAMGVEEMDFVMTNPPFYSSDQDMQASYTGKSAPPSAVCTGAENEMICPGGDVGFVSRILDESLKLGGRVQWYTVMLGKMSSLQTIIAKLREHGVTNFAVTCLQAGYRTKRWAVAWSFRDYRPRNDVARHGELVLSVLPTATAQTIAVRGLSKEAAGGKIDELVKGLDVKWRWRGEMWIGVMEARVNVWSRAARRNRRFARAGKGKEAPEQEAEDGESSEEEEEDVVALAVKITCKEGEVELRWLRGLDYVLFESFCGLTKRALVGGR